MRSLRLLGSIVLLAVIAALAAPSGAAPTAEAATRQRVARVLEPGPMIHLLPTRAVAASLQSGGPAAAAPASLQYYGGPVMRANTKTVAVFWEPSTLQDGTPVSVSATYHTLIERFLGDVGGHGLYSGLTQYHESADSTTKYIVNSSRRLASVTITSPYPAAAGGCATDGRTNCLTDAQIRSKLTSVIEGNGLPVNRSTLYLVFTAPLEESCYSASACFNPVTSTDWAYCAYHSAFFTSAGKPVIYANMPYVHSNATSISGCAFGAAHPNDPAFDDETATLSHEIVEAVTDPFPGGPTYPTAWTDPTYGEIADICASSYTAEVTWNGNPYEVAAEWSNATDACVRGGAQELAASPGSGPPGSSVLLSGSGFGDGEQVTLTFFDADGRAFPLGTTAASGGMISTSVQIPAGARPGRGTFEAVGSVPEDGAAVDVTVTGSYYRPDLLVGRARGGPFAGNGIYSATGANEKMSAWVRPGTKARFWIKVRNVGTSTDTLRLRGTKATPGFTVVYREGTKDVSKAVLAGTYRQRLGAKAYFLLQVVVSVKVSTGSGKVFAAKVLAVSGGDTTKKDAVVASVTSG